MYEAPALYINGKELRPARNPTFDVLNPATEEVLGACVTAGPEEVAASLVAARQGLAAWGKVSAWDRSNILRKTGNLLRERIDAVATIMTLEVGKPLAEAKGEVTASADHLDWCADEARRLYDLTLPGRTAASQFHITHEPVGIVLGLTAWNAPISLATRKLAMSLAAGCSIILRPAEEAPATVAALVRCFRDAGVPPGVISLIYGSPEAIVVPLMAEYDVRMCSFTGSTRVGQLLVRQGAETLKRMALELGGHAPVMVLEDADLDKAAAASVLGKIRNAGQVCTSPSRFFVHKSLIEQFSAKVTAGLSKIKVGNGLEAGVLMGPLATQRQRERAERLVEDARKKGATVTTGGKRPGDKNRGYFYEPTVLTNLPENAQVLSEEPFCPIASIVPFSDIDEALSRANGLEAGLAGYIFTRSGNAADYVASKLQVGVIAVNNFQVASAEAPFGGIKAGGYGREGGREGVAEFLNIKSTHKMVA